MLPGVTQKKINNNNKNVIQYESNRTNLNELSPTATKATILVPKMTERQA